VVSRLIALSVDLYKAGKNMTKHIKANWGHIGLRLLGWSFLLWLFVLVVASFRNEHVRAQQYHADLIKYGTQLQEYNATIAEYRQELKNYYGELVNLSSSGTIPADVSIVTVKTNTEQIGNEIEYTYQINNQPVSNNEIVELYLFDQNTLFSEIREDDLSHDDVGNKTDKLRFSLSELSTGVSVTQDISVHESYGRDAGNTARYRVTYTLQLHDALNTKAKTVDNEPEYPKVTKPLRPERTDVKIRWYFVLTHDWLTKLSAIVVACLFAFLIIRQTVTEVSENKNH